MLSVVIPSVIMLHVIIQRAILSGTFQFYTECHYAHRRGARILSIMTFIITTLGITNLNDIKNSA
jgi:hypothetical protein